MDSLFAAFNPLLVASLLGTLLIFGLMYFAMQTWSETSSRSAVRKRLDVNTGFDKSALQKDSADDPKKPRRAAKTIAKRANDFYASNDPKAVRKMQMRLMQAGFMHENALGYFIAARIVLGFGAAILGGILVLFVLTGLGPTHKLLVLLLTVSVGYFLPNFYMDRRIKALQSENRAGFPDVLDLMVVSSEAGLTMEASIDRIAVELEKTYPTLSRQLTLAGIEIRAGRPIDQALRAFGERLGLEEVQGFATMVQQSKELGTSVSDALRVYSDEMRHKRMMMAEEKAYALPAKLSIPVTGFILPVVLGVAVLPTAVRMMNQ